MNFIKLENSGSQEFKEAWEIYESSFPLNERRKLASQKELLIHKQYNFFIVTKDEIIAAIITDWNFGNFLFIEHLAVKKDLRGQGIGTEILKKYLSTNKQKIVLEVELPKIESAAKRITFYEKIGFKINDFDYMQPSYGKGKNPVPMLLMTYPKHLTESEFSTIREKLHLTVYRDL